LAQTSLAQTSLAQTSLPQILIDAGADVSSIAVGSLDKTGT